MQPEARAGPSFQAAISSGKFHGIALDLGRPSSHVAEHVDSQRNVRSLGDVKRLAVIQAFDVTELLGVLFEQVSEFPDEAAALGCRHPVPGAVFKRIAGGLHRLINVLAIAFRNLSENFAGRGIVGGKGFS